MIQSNYPVWKLTRETRQKLRTAGVKATDLAAWGAPSVPLEETPAFERAVYTYKAKPRWSKARKARAALRRQYPDGVVPADGRRLGPLFADLSDAIFSITPTATPFLMNYYCTCGDLFSAGRQCACRQPASADPVHPLPADPASRAPLYLDETGKGASAARAEIDIMDALRSAVKENW